MKELKKSTFILIFSSLFFCSPKVFSQNIEQTVSGRITDATSGEVLPGATIRVLDTDQGTVSDESGRYSLKLPVGYHRIVVSFVGYSTLVKEEFLLTAGKQAVLDVRLQRSYVQLEDAEVTTKAIPMELSSRKITPEQVQRYAATFYDPVRLGISLPAVSATNDQNNNVSVRGTSPAWNQWRLEGVEIASPNHLTNAGTFSDRPTQNGGGVNILSAQMLSDSRILYGGYNADKGNALGAIFDMNLRKGNRNDRQHTLQASLIGFDLATEGPFSKTSKASYLINYRYSFTGLLAAMGVDFGGEEIKFQDLSFTLNFPHEGGYTKVFALGGLSSNDFTGVEDFLEAEEEKDLYDISYEGKMMAAGITHSTRLLKQFRWENTLVYSLNHNERKEERGEFPQFPGMRKQSEGYNENKLSLRSVISSSVGTSGDLSVGLNAVRYVYNLPFSFDATEVTNTIRYRRELDEEEWLWQPFLNYRTSLGESLTLEAGMNFTRFETSDEFFPEPRLFLKYFLGNSGSSIYLRSGLYSQIQSYTMRYGTAFNFAVITAPQNGNLEINKAAKFQVGYLTGLGGISLNIEAFYDHYYDIPYHVGVNVPGNNRLGDQFSAFNISNELIAVTFNDKETGNVSGIEVSAEKKLSGSWYYLLGGTYYHSTFQVPGTENLDSRWDGRYAFNGTLGKEVMLKPKGQKQRSLSMNARVIYQGGYRRNPLDVAASNQSQTDVLAGNIFALDRKNPDYFRLDLRFAWRVEKQNYTRTLSFDLQNATNYENFFYERYDRVAGEVIESSQLGLIPLLTYRVEF